MLSTSRSFNPPTPEQVTEHLQACHPQPTPRWHRFVPLGVIVIAAVVMLLIDNPIAVILPWLAVAGLVWYGARRMQRARQLDHEVDQTGEQAMLRRFPQALAQAWTILPRLNHHPSLHARTAAILGHSLDDLGHHEAALVCYDHLLGGMPKDQPAAMHIKVNRAICALRTDRLIEADDALRQLRGEVEVYRQTSIKAAFEFAQLLQHVRTNHYAEALEMRESLLDELRPLGIEAGFGHALMALCCRQAREADQAKASDQHSAAQLWWSRATCLLSPNTLLQTFPELKGFESSKTS